MRESWQNLTMLEACDLITCGVAARPNYVDDGIPFLSAKNVKEGKILYTDFNSISLETHLELTKKNKPLPGDILYTRVGSYGEAAVIENNIEFSVFVSLTLIKPKKQLLDSHFLRYYLNSHEIKTLAKKSITSSGVGNLNVGTVRKFPVKIPPIKEQKEIVEILDQAFESIEKAKANIEKNIENAKELFRSKLNQIFYQNIEGFIMKEFNQLAEYDKTKYLEKNLPYVGLEDIESDTGVFLGSKKNTKEVKSSTFKFTNKHILYGRLRPYLNKVLVPDFEGHCSTEIFPILVSENVNKFFLFYWFLAPITVRKIDSTWTGARMPRANMNLVKSFKIPVPPIQKQKEIVEALDILDNHIQSLLVSYEEELKNLEELKKSILQKAFSGELTNKNKAA